MIPRIYWAITHSGASNPAAGYAASTFSVFNVSDFADDVAPDPTMVANSRYANITQCR